MFKRPTNMEIKEMIIRHLNMLCDFKGEYTAVREIRKHIAWYVKGLENATKIRNEINKIEDKNVLIDTLNEFLK